MLELFTVSELEYFLKYHWMQNKNEEYDDNLQIIVLK